MQSIVQLWEDPNTLAHTYQLRLAAEQTVLQAEGTLDHRTLTLWLGEARTNATSGLMKHFFSRVPAIELLFAPFIGFPSSQTVTTLPV